MSDDHRQSKPKIFTCEEVTNLTGICAGQPQHPVKRHRLGFISRTGTLENHSVSIVCQKRQTLGSADQNQARPQAPYSRNHQSPQHFAIT